MKIRNVTLLILSALSLSAQQQTTKPSKEVKTPEMTDALKAKYWKARARQLSAVQEAKDANEAMQAVVTELQTFCGNSAILSGDKNGDASCLAKEPPPEAEKPQTK